MFMLRFWIWVSLRAQEAVVRDAQRAMRKHLEDTARHGSDEHPAFVVSNWYARRDRLKRHYSQEIERLHMMGGGIEKPERSRRADGSGV